MKERAEVHIAESLPFKPETQNMHLKASMQRWILWAPVCCWSREAESEP